VIPVWIAPVLFVAGVYLGMVLMAIFAAKGPLMSRSLFSTEPAGGRILAGSGDHSPRLSPLRVPWREVVPLLPASVPGGLADAPA
jgi:hypothetical protein